jgi:hypothetical protein
VYLLSRVGVGTIHRRSLLCIYSTNIYRIAKCLSKVLYQSSCSPLGHPKFYSKRYSVVGMLSSTTATKEGGKKAPSSLGVGCCGGFSSSLEKKFLLSMVISGLFMVIWMEYNQNIDFFQGRYFLPTTTFVATRNSNNNSNSRGNSSLLPLKQVSTSSLSTCFHSNSNSQHQTATSLHPWTHNNNLPQYIKDYLDWHVEMTCNITDAPHQEKQQQARYLVVRCIQEFNRCGGLSDRLRPLPVYIFAAIQMNRILLIQWTKPCPLEEFLTPTPWGINWTVPSWLSTPRQTSADIVNFGKLHDRHFIAKSIEQPILTIKIQWPPEDAYNNFISQFYNDSTHVYNKVYSHLFSSFFTLVRPIQSIVDQQMATLGLTPSSYTSIHVRARHPNSGFYPLKNRHADQAIDKEGGFVLPEQEGKYKDKITKTLQMAFHCASSLNDTNNNNNSKNNDNTQKKIIYFASDSHHLNNYVVQQQGIQLPSTYVIVSMNHSKEPLHLDIPGNTTREPSDFYMAFVDLWILSHAQCILYGTGRFGLFASYISLNKNSTCSRNYQTSPNCITPATE